MKFGIVGTGVIGAGWATRALSRGWDVVATDPAPGAEARLRTAVERSWPSVRKIGLYPGADPARIEFVATPQDVGERADFVQESAPEVLELKQTVLRAVDETAGPDVIVASSTSGLLPTRLQEGMRHPERFVVGHPFNPVYLLPLCEVLGGEATAPDVVERAIAVYDDLDMYPLLVRNEVDGFLGDRLQEALWREILHLVADGVATTGELDDSIVYGPGLRWAAMGTNLTYHLAGGEAGMRHMLKQFGPALEWPWTKLVAPPLTDELIDRMVEGTQEQAAGRSIAELERLRDDYLISVMYSLRESRLGAGSIIARREGRTVDRAAPTRWTPGMEIETPLPLYQCRVAPDWVDYNDHMTESAYLLAFGWASDAFFRYIGIDEDYRAAKHSFYTVESHLVYTKEVSTGEPLVFTTQLLGHDHKRLHFFHSMYHGDSGDLLCTNEQVLVHVDMEAGRSANTLDGPKSVLDEIWKVHGLMDRPPKAVMNITGR
ncbi:MAG: L-carnitine dehydrogenase [Acidimicrobiia bacterium]|nr:L-carnitine dehydrogenase [Acidimicrobiia bacterium]MDH4308469.1 L-carnitine dehydrogenase [Acidimicrobiia bacterium]